MSVQFCDILNTFSFLTFFFQIFQVKLCPRFSALQKIKENLVNLIFRLPGDQKFALCPQLQNFRLMVSVEQIILGRSGAKFDH